MTTEKTRKKIIKAAVELFSNTGYKKTTTRKIAEVAGVNESTIFRTFKNKDTLFKEILSLSNGFKTIINVIKESDLNNDIKALLKTVANLFGQLYKDNPSFIRIFLRCAIDHEEMNYLENTMGPGAYHYLANLLHKMNESHSISLRMEPDKAAFYFLSLVHGAYQREMMFSEKKNNINIDTDELVTLFVSGIIKE